jgi:hypothetical protein
MVNVPWMKIEYYGKRAQNISGVAEQSDIPKKVKSFNKKIQSTLSNGSDPYRSCYNKLPTRHIA